MNQATQTRYSPIFSGCTARAERAFQVKHVQRGISIDVGGFRSAWSACGDLRSCGQDDWLLNLFDDACFSFFAALLLPAEAGLDFRGLTPGA
jgi:hypothetical protein